MASSRPARWLAPLALLGAIGAILLVISSSPGGSKSSTDGISSSSQTSTAVGTTSTGTTSTGTTSTTSGTPPRFYVVKPGDVLSAIADATGVPLTRIEQLNPNVDAQTLHAGQKIKLVP